MPDPNFLSPESIIDSIAGAYRDTLSLTNFDTRLWTARVQDQDAAAILASHTKADANALKVRKYLFEGTERHQALLGAIRHSYTVHKELTKGTRNFRVIPNAGIGEYLSAMDRESVEIKSKLDDFQQNYTNDCTVGQQHLGDLAQYADKLYKPIERLPELFGISYEPLLPFPDEENFGSMDQNTLYRLQSGLEKNIRARLELTFEDALEEFSSSLVAVEKRLQEKLATFDHPVQEGKRAPQIRLTSTVLSTPVTQAQMLRRFSRGEWSEKMGRIETALDRILLVKDLARKPELIKKALQAVQTVRAVMAK